jgi:tRNA-dependent cyclodipeptide synthase
MLFTETLSPLTPMTSDISLVGKKLFIPISIGNHFYSKKVFKFILKDLVSVCDSTVIFICDRLRYLIYTAKEYGTHEEILAHVDQEFDQLERTLINSGFKDGSKTQIWRWKDIEETEHYRNILVRLTEASHNNREISSFLEPFTCELTAQFYGADYSEKQLKIQREYILVESALSIYMTEVAGFSHELYKSYDRGLIVELYQHHSELVKKIVGKEELSRHFIALMNLVEFENQLNT